MPIPIDVVAVAGKTVGWAVYFLIGMGFGAVLESAGFGDSRKLAAQFYLRDMTVLKVMFTGICVACVLIFFSSAMGWLDFAQLVVNPTYLWPGIVGGLIMGAGFIVGGFCPGTSVVSAATLKLDGIAFVLGALIGVGVFGESVPSFSAFWHSSFHDRWILPEWLRWSTGLTVVAVVAMALVLFYGAGLAERRLAGEPLRWIPKGRWQIAGSAALLGLALATWAVGQPSPERKWQLLHARHEALLATRAAYVHPLEYVKTWNDPAIRLVTLDLRSAEEYQRFHLAGARRLELAQLSQPEVVRPLLNLPAHGVVVLVGRGETESTTAWQWLKALGVTNLYILENGADGWQKFFAGVHEKHGPLDLSRPSNDVVAQFAPDAYRPKIQLKTTRRAAGACS